MSSSRTAWQEQQQLPPPPPYRPPGEAGSVNFGYTANTPGQTDVAGAPKFPQSTTAPAGQSISAVEAGAADSDVGFSSRGLDDVSVRRGFIRKVYLILTCQLAFTFGMVLLVTLYGPLGELVRNNSWLFYLSCAVFIVVYIVMICSRELRRKTPGNFIALFVFTVAMTLMASTLAAFTSSNSVLVSMGITAGVCIGVTLFVLQTRIDFTLIVGLIFGVLLVIVLFGLSCMATFLIYRNSLDPMSARLLDCVYGGLVALLLALCLMFDTHQVVSGSRYGLSEEEYVFGALQLYIDVVYIFILMLGIRGGR